MRVWAKIVVLRLDFAVYRSPAVDLAGDWYAGRDGPVDREPAAAVENCRMLGAVVECEPYMVDRGAGSPDRQDRSRPGGSCFGVRCPLLLHEHDLVRFERNCRVVGVQSNVCHRGTSSVGHTEELITSGSDHQDRYQVRGLR